MTRTLVTSDFRIAKVATQKNLNVGYTFCPVLIYHDRCNTVVDTLLILLYLGYGSTLDKSGYDFFDSEFILPWIPSVVCACFRTEYTRRRNLRANISAKGLLWLPFYAIATTQVNRHSGNMWPRPFPKVLHRLLIIGLNNLLRIFCGQSSLQINAQSNANSGHDRPKLLSLTLKKLLTWINGHALRKISREYEEIFLE